MTHIKASSMQKKQEQDEVSRFEEIKNGAQFDESEDILPDRNDFAAVYHLIQNSVRLGTDTLKHRDIIAKFRANPEGRDIGYIKLKIIIMVFKELNLISIEDVAYETYKFKLHYSTTKTKLDKSTLLRRLRSQMIRNG